MALGLGQLAAVQSSPDFPSGSTDWLATEGIFDVEPSPSQDVGQTGMVHMAGTSQGAGNSGTQGNRASSWSNLLDLKNGPLGWLAILTILYLGLISLHVSAGIGRRR